MAEEENKKQVEKKKIPAAGVVAICFASILFLIIVISIISSIVSENKKAATNSNTPTSTESTAKPKYVFDVPLLIGKNIDEIRKILGEPVEKEFIEPTQEQISLGATEWDNTFNKDGKDLLVTFGVKSRKAIEFFISTDDPSGKTQDKNHLLELGNLSENSDAYKVGFVKALKDTSSFTGVTATPK